MLLHNSYINVAIAHILVYLKRLYNLHKPIYKFYLSSQYRTKGVAEYQGWQGQNKLQFLVFALR